MLDNGNLNVFLNLVVLELEDALASNVVFAGLSHSSNLVSELNGSPFAGNFTVTALCAVHGHFANFFSGNVLDVSSFGAERKEARLVVVKNENGALGVSLVEDFSGGNVEKHHFEFLVGLPLFVVNNFNLDFAPLATVSKINFFVDRGEVFSFLSATGDSLSSYTDLDTFSLFLVMNLDADEFRRL